MRAWLRTAAAVAMMVAVAWSLPALSQEDQAAAALRQTIEEWLSSIDARTGGPIVVRKEGDALAATLPDLAIVMPEWTVRLGTITLVRREIAEGRHRYEAPLPRTIRLEEARETSTVTIADGSFTVVVDPRTNTVHAYEGMLTNLMLEGSADPDRLSIAALEMTGTITQRADGLADSPGRVRMQGLRVDMPGTSQVVSLGELTMTGNLLGFRLADYERLRDATDAATRAGDVQELLRIFEQWLSFSFTTAQLDLSLSDLAYRDGAEAPAVVAARIVFGLAFESLATPRTGLRLRYAHDGFAVRDDVAALPAEYRGLAATAVSLEIAVAGLPSAELRDTLVNGLSSGAITDDTFWADAFDALLTAAIDNGATLRLAPFEATSPLIGVSGNATLTGNDRSPLSAVGSGEIVIRGLEDAARALVDPSDPVAAILAIVSAIGQAGTDDAGRPTRSYRIEADEQGRIMLNGNDLSALIGGAAGGGAAPQPAPPQPGATPGK